MTITYTGPGIYWGVGGEYGPFEEQKTGEWAGWPDFGQVMRYFRRKARMSPKEFGEIYGRSATSDGRPISDRQLRRMENENQVPVDIDKRKLIARLLNIPPMLLGLAVLESVTLKPHPEVAGSIIATGHTTITKVTVDTTKYQNNIRALSTLHYTSQIQSKLESINADIRDLESLETQTRGDLRYHIQELLFSYHLLAEKVTRDQQKYTLSHYYANRSVRVALATGDTDLIATARYTRGRTYLAWGRNGTLVNGVFQVQIDKINKAIRDFANAKQVAENTEKSLHPQLVGLIGIYLSRALAIRSVSQGEKVPPLVLTMLDETEEKVGRENIHDPYQLKLVTGSPIGFVKGEYLNGRAVVLTIAGMAGAALKDIATLKGLRQGSIGKDLTRKQIWLDIATADVYMGLEQFGKAIEHARGALLACQDINSVETFARVVDIHGRLLKSRYKNNADVKELGDMLRETIGHVEQEDLLGEIDY